MANGLDDVVAAETVLSDIDGESGQLVLRGHGLDELAGRTRYAEALALLLDGLLEGLPAAAELGPALGRARAEVYLRLRGQVDSLADQPLFDGVRAMMATLPDGHGLQSALSLIAAPAVLVPALLRRRGGGNPVAPAPELDHAADILRMLDGAEPEPVRAAALDRYLVTVIDHGLNASTFAARVVASTGAGLTSAVLAALGALKGPLHGGAPGPVLEMLDAIGEAGKAEAWIAAELAAGRRLPGFGHRVYRVRDPRADALNAAIEQLRDAGAAAGGRLALAASVERAALAALARHKPDRPLLTNVEFYTALLLEALGFPRDGFTAVFAMGRCAGWIGHSREQALHGRLLRPRSRYIGPRPQQAA